MLLRKQMRPENRFLIVTNFLTLALTRLFLVEIVGDAKIAALQRFRPRESGLSRWRASPRASRGIDLPRYY